MAEVSVLVILVAFVVQVVHSSAVLDPRDDSHVSISHVIMLNID